MKIYPYLLPLLLLAGCASQLPSPAPRQPVPPASKPSAPTKPALPPAKPEQIPQQMGGYYQDDGPILAVPYDLDALQEPEVKAEPLHRYANRPYRALGRSYAPLKQYGDYSAEGRASWYGKKFHGKRTASGEPYDMFQLSAAHPLLPIPSYARVTNLANGKAVVVRVNDRGPFHKGREIDLSYAAAYRLGFHNLGSAKVKVESLQPGETVAAAELQAKPEMAESSPPPAPALPAVAQADGNAAIRWVQLGAFATQAAAESFRSKVSAALGWLESAPALAEGAGVWRVRLGPYPDRKQAQAMADRIIASGDVRAVVVR